MKQHITKFEKSTPRLLAFILLGVGLIGMALTVGEPHLPFAAAEAGAWIMLGGFAGATVFLALWGAGPVPSGNDEVEVEERVQVQMSDELKADLKQKVDKAVSSLASDQKSLLDAVAKSSAGLSDSINTASKSMSSNIKSSADAAVADINKLQQDVNTELGRIKSELAKMEIDQVQREFKGFVNAVDAEKTTKAVNSLMSQINESEQALKSTHGMGAKFEQISKSADQNYAEMEKNIKALEQDFKSRTEALSAKLSEINKEIEKMASQFQQFNM